MNTAGPWKSCSFEGITAVVTGGASGIGLATALMLSSRGARVAVVDWSEGAEDGRAYFRADVSKRSEITAAFSRIQEDLGAIRVLVNCAAIQVTGSLPDIREEDWDRQHAINLKGSFLCSQAAAKQMKSAGGGAIVNVSSVLGFVGDPTLTAYSAMKGGLIALTKALAIGLGPDGIRVNCVCPGDVNTPMVKQYFDAAPDPERLRADVYSNYALGRIGDASEIAEVICFLASSASSFVTGSTIVVDGGLTSKCY